jgi:hypothetical protein
VRKKLRASVAVAGVCLAVLGCKTITEELPTTSSTGNPTVNVPIPVVVTPVDIPQPQNPAPAATPTPSGNEPAPTATPTPSDTPGTPASSCAPAPAPGNEKCPREGSSDFLGAVEAAYDLVIAEHPNWFSSDKTRVNLSEDEWAWAVVGALRRRGYCAGLYGEEVSVRTSRAYSENFDVVTSTGIIRRGANTYRSTCYPASTTRE